MSNDDHVTGGTIFAQTAYHNMPAAIKPAALSVYLLVCQITNPKLYEQILGKMPQIDADTLRMELTNLQASLEIAAVGLVAGKTGGIIKKVGEIGSVIGEGAIVASTFYEKGTVTKIENDYGLEATIKPIDNLDRLSIAAVGLHAVAIATEDVKLEMVVKNLRFAKIAATLAKYAEKLAPLAKFAEHLAEDSPLMAVINKVDVKMVAMIMKAATATEKGAEKLATVLEKVGVSPTLAKSASKQVVDQGVAQARQKIVGLTNVSQHHHLKTNREVVRLTILNGGAPQLSETDKRVTFQAFVRQHSNVQGRKWGFIPVIDPQLVGIGITPLNLVKQPMPDLPAEKIKTGAWFSLNPENGKIQFNFIDNPALTARTERVFAWLLSNEGKEYREKLEIYKQQLDKDPKQLGVLNAMNKEFAFLSNKLFERDIKFGLNPNLVAKNNDPFIDNVSIQNAKPVVSIQLKH